MSEARAEAERILKDWMRDEPELRDEDRFDRVVALLFEHQFQYCAPYRRFCEGRGRTPGSISSWKELPFVPTGAFKETKLCSFPESDTTHVFRTSGTSNEKRGELHLDDLSLYEASLQPSFERGVLPDLAAGQPLRFLTLAPSRVDAPDSSLSHMFGVMHERRGDPDSAFLIGEEALHLDRTVAALEFAATGSPTLALCGTAFSFVHLCEGLAERGQKLELPPTARIMETGGFKGRSRTMERDELYGLMHSTLGVPSERIVNQYGMTELASQFYDSVLRHPGEARRKLLPPWTRVLLVDPTTGSEVEEGTSGMICILDLANAGSVMAVQTADLGRSIEDGFEVLGRSPGAEARGCSIAADEMLGA